MIDYCVSSEKGFQGKIGELVWMLKHTREVTMNEIRGLQTDRLDYLANEHANSIGALLAHMAAIEFVHQVISFENRDLTETEYENWKVALDLGEEGRTLLRNRPIDHYLEELSTVRNNTLSLLQEKEESWLFEENKWDNGVRYNNYYLWFHVMEDEISHRGQIRTIKRLIDSK